MQTIEAPHPVTQPLEGAGAAPAGARRDRSIRIAAGAVTAALAVIMTASGLMFLFLSRGVAEGIHRLGYPDYFARLLGLAKLLGVAAILAPRTRSLREWAYAGFTFTAVAAICSHLASGDGPALAAPAALVLGATLASWYLRRRAAAAPRPVARAAGTTPALRRSVWFGRLVVGGAAILFTAIALRQIVDPIGASAPHQIVLGSGDAVTITRVTGGTFLGLALVLAACVGSERRLLTGLGVLATVIAVVTAVRVAGLVLDGPAPFTVRVLKPEAILVVLSSLAFLVERRRRQRAGPVGVETRS